MANKLFGGTYWNVNDETRYGYDPKLNKQVLMPNKLINWSTLGMRSDGTIVLILSMQRYEKDVAYYAADIPDLYHLLGCKS